MSQEETLKETFERLVDQTFFNYKGILVTREGLNYIAFGKMFTSLDEIQKQIDSASVAIEKSIK